MSSEHDLQPVTWCRWSDRNEPSLTCTNCHEGDQCGHCAATEGQIRRDERGAMRSQLLNAMGLIVRHDSVEVKR